MAYQHGPHGSSPPQHGKAAPSRRSVGLAVVIAALALAAVAVGAVGWILISTGAIGGGTQPAATAEASQLAGAEPAATATWNNLPVRDGSLEFWVEKVESARQVVPELFGKPAYNLGRTAQGQFVIVHVTVTNLGGVQGQFVDANQALFDAQDRRYSTAHEVGTYFNTATFHDPIRVAGRVRGVLAFEVPRNLTDFEVELHESSMSGGARIPIHLGPEQALLVATEVA